MPEPPRRGSAEELPHGSADGVRHATGWRAVAQALLRPSRSHLVVAVILMLAGLGITLQVRTLATQQDYSTLRRSELIGILDDLTAESRRLEAQIVELEQTRDELRSGADSQQVAREEAARRREELEILAGTIPARGQGVRVVIDDPSGGVGSSILLNALSELRDAGAEVIELNDQVRVAAGTWVAGDGAELTVDGVVLTRPLSIDAIGDPHALSEALRFRGGLVSEISDERVGGRVTITSDAEVTIGSTRQVTQPRFARPA
ncbi:MAG TPA: DUF881 domain-containing protein [Propionicimonas sp.]|jgi:uncharacterized protein YlxW (UPF0749 family)|nr:DUF881 domain-containing protein [Propionicimonas sp.]